MSSSCGWWQQRQCLDRVPHVRHIRTIPTLAALSSSNKSCLHAHLWSSPPAKIHQFLLYKLTLLHKSNTHTSSRQFHFLYNYVYKAVKPRNQNCAAQSKPSEGLALDACVPSTASLSVLVFPAVARSHSSKNQ